MKPKKLTQNQMIEKAMRDHSRNPKPLPPPKKPQQRIQGWDSKSWESTGQ